MNFIRSFNVSFIHRNKQQKELSHNKLKPVASPSNHAKDDCCSDSDVCITSYTSNAESDHDRDDSSSFIKRGYGIISSPTGSDVKSEAISDILMDDVKDEDFPITRTTENQDLSNTSYTYDEITRLLGENTLIDEYLSNLFNEEESNNSLSWYTKPARRKIKPLAREHAVQWLRNTAIHLKLQDATLFKTIYYFDKLCSIKQMNSEHLIMVAAVCLFIACKFNERDYDIPHLRRITRECKTKYNADVFHSSERKILNALDFRLKVVLPIDFIEYFIYQKGIVFDDDSKDKDLHKFCVFFLYIASLSYSFWKYKPSVMAMAVICAARRAMKITPYFNRKLLDICGHEVKDVDECFVRLWSKYESKFPDKAKYYESFQPKSLIDF
eukprot:263063_1